MEKSSDNRIVDALERERRFLAEELHEGLCQTLCGIAIHLKALQRRLESESPELARAYLGLQQTIDEGIDQSRVLYRTLKPPVSGGDSLMQALAELAKAKHATLDFRESFCDGADRIAPQQATALLRIAQEALRDCNASETESASRICLEIARSAVRLNFDDNDDQDDVGFDVIAAHATAAGGAATLRRGEVAGRIIECTIPLARA